MEKSQEIITSRIEAKLRNEKFYFTGKPCKYGHISKRFTNNHGCVECYNIFIQSDIAKNKRKQFYQNNREDRIRKQRDYYNKNKDKIGDYQKEYRNTHKEECKEYRTEYYKNNKQEFLDNRKKYVSENKEKVRESSKNTQQKYKKEYRQKFKQWNARNKEQISQNKKKYYIKNKPKVLANVKKRKYKKKLAVPSWYDDEHKQIQEIYELSVKLTNETGIPHHVDHIIPISHPLVCGLHCLANLRVITAEENRHKYNNLLSEYSGFDSEY